MNERIEDLYKQAQKSVIFLSNSKESKEKIVIEKFAELIVRECIGVVKNLSPGYKDYRDQIEDAFRRDCVEEMKQHFGVEE